MIKAMKSKSFDLKESAADKGNQVNHSFDFIGLYKSAAETNVRLLDKQKLSESPASTVKPSTSKREHSPNKKKKKNEPVDISHITIDGRSLNQTAGRSSPVNKTRLTSTPYSTAKILKQEPKVKSIMKNSSTIDVDATDDTIFDPTSFKRKKRNKSVSFMLDDTEEVAVKKTKSNESVKVDKKDKVKAKHFKDETKKKEKKFKKNLLAEKENKGNANMDTDNIDTNTDKSKTKELKNLITDATATADSENQNHDNQRKKKKFKKINKQKKPEESCESVENKNQNNEESSENKTRKLKKKKRQSKSPQVSEAEGEPATKFCKKEDKSDIIAEDLENLSIGDNAHTLTNLLDEMAVVDKDQRKKNKHKLKNKTPNQAASVSSSEAVDLEKIEEGKEKIKWKKRKWNKDKKGCVDQEELETSVIIDNLPIKYMTCYKKLLTDHFGKLGLIKKIGIAEVYPTEEPKPVFTTTINFYSEGAASKALEEDNTSLEGSRIRVKPLLPPTQTTLVVRTYGELNEQTLSSVFIQAGRIRSIRLLVKGKKTIGTAFIEFDGPIAVERAIKMAAEAKIGGKKIHVSKYEQRGGKKRDKKPKSNADSENEGDSEDSND